jgi:hypothetical protein
MKKICKIKSLNILEKNISKALNIHLVLIFFTGDLDFKGDPDLNGDPNLLAALVTFAN